jgi:hypothetical protein
VASIYVVQDPKRAGCGLLTVALDDLDAFETHLREAGLAFEEQVAGSTPRRLLVRDTDGNKLAFFRTQRKRTRESRPAPVRHRRLREDDNGGLFQWELVSSGVYPKVALAAVRYDSRNAMS